MIGTDKETYEKMVAVFQITQIPALKMSTNNGQASFTWAKGFITGFPMAQFYALEPIEIAMLIEAALEEFYSVPKKYYRNKFTGFKKDPFSSQN
jgi:hypothetical protein|tara:strand:+ start:832 stop:1113 length:282 start_codon:yes stop_codon:yes gene_type:complete